MECQLCGSKNGETLESKKRAFHACHACGFVRAHPSSDPDEAHARARYALHRNSLDDPGYVAYLEAILRTGLDRCASRPSAILDWGSGPEPVAAKLLRSWGYEVTTWDPCFCADRIPPAASFDLVFCIEVAEHFTDPLRDFFALFSRLRSGGIALIHTHLAPSDMKAFNSWWYMQDPTHVSFYSEAALKFLAEINSFSIMEIIDKKICVMRKEAA